MKKLNKFNLNKKQEITERYKLWINKEIVLPKKSLNFLEYNFFKTA